MTGVDLSETQLATARENLARTPWCSDRYTLQQADASELPFEARSFDAAFLCWVLEHVPSPARVLSEVRRVLAPGSPVYITEVMNASFLLDPYSPHIWRYWMAFNDFQYDHGATRSSAPSWATCCWPAASATCTPRSRPSTWTTASRRVARR